MSSSEIYERAMDYHRKNTPGKLAIIPTKALTNQADLALAYSPGVAGPCLAIQKDPAMAAEFTSRGNLIAVISNGTAVLGLGNIGPLASKPVMEGKAVLFKKFSGIDVFDIEINENDPDKIVNIIAALEPTFGGINLEDIKAPECFYIEKKLSERVNIPVFHDDQHGTAIIVCAAIENGLAYFGKKIENVKLVTSGAGAAAIACLDLLIAMGLKPENVTLCDSKGVVYPGRDASLDPSKARYARETKARTLEDAIAGADIFLGLSVGGLVTQNMVTSMAKNALILALANPEPEIRPDLVHQVRDDIIIATGRSDYPNQVNNVLCFPFIFRGALDVGATKINQEMKLACVKALAALTRAEGSDIATDAYGGEIHRFGKDYIIPKPFDPRLAVEVPLAVAQAAMESGVATRAIDDWDAYRQKLTCFIYRSSMVMQPIFQQAKKAPMRVAFADGEDERVLWAVQTLVDEQLCHPMLIGRPDVIHERIDRLGLRLRDNTDYTIINPQDDHRYLHYWQTYHHLMARKGITPDVAKVQVRTNTTVIAALMVHLGDADTMIAGCVGRYQKHVAHVINILGISPRHDMLAALSVLVLDQGVYFITDPYVNPETDAQQVVEMTVLAAEQVKRFGIKPRIALLSHSNFGSSKCPSAQKMRRAFQLLQDRHPEIEVEGEMHADAALSESIRNRIFPNSNLTENANLLVMPSLNAANIAFNMTKVLGKGLHIGPILMGTEKPGHILTPSITVRGLINMAALAVVDAQARQPGHEDT